MSEAFRLAHVFSDNMVLQRDAAIPIFGWAEEGAAVRLELAGRAVETVAAEGRWCVDLPPMPAGGPFELEAICGGRRIVLRNILVGEVWLAGGQSNMDYQLFLTRDGASEIPAADYPDIRYYLAPRAAVGDGADGAGQPAWQVCTPEAAKTFSAVAYHFAKEVHRTLGVPVGIISCSWGGTSASCWMSEERLERNGDIRVYLDEYRETVSRQDPQEFEASAARYEAEVAAHGEKVGKIPFDPAHVQEYFEAQADIPYPWPPPMGPSCFLRPAGLYYTMLQKLRPYAVRGVIWYQGESDTHRAALYGRLFTEMMGNWREDWGAPLPFLTVQLSSYGDVDPDGINWAELREQQLILSQSTAGVGMAVSIDYGDKNNIHPIDKKPVGERLALLARAKVYGEDIECSGPALAGAARSGGCVELVFDHAGQGLYARGGDLKGFQVASADGKFIGAQATIAGDRVTVCSPAVPEPVAVRYGWANYTDANLYNSHGLPASPFRADVGKDMKI